MLVSDPCDYAVMRLADRDIRRDAILILAKLRTGIHVVQIVMAIIWVPLQIAQDLQDLPVV